MNITIVIASNKISEILDYNDIKPLKDFYENSGFNLPTQFKPFHQSNSPAFILSFAAVFSVATAPLTSSFITEAILFGALPGNFISIAPFLICALVFSLLPKRLMELI